MPGRTPSRRPRGYVMTPAEAPRFWQLGNLWRIVASGHLTGGSVSLSDQLVGDGGGPSTHMHPSDEGLYVASGQCTFNAGGQTVIAEAGSLVFVPRYTEHSFTVDVPNSQLLNFYVPAGFEMFIMGMGHPATENRLPKKGEVPMPPPDLIMMLSRDYDQLEVPGIPMAVTKMPEPHEFVTKANPDAVVQPFMATTKSSPRYWHDGELWSVLADAARTDGSCSVFDIYGRRGAGAPPHESSEADVFYHVLDGSIDVLIGDKVKTANKGDFVFIPHGTVHARRTTSDSARLLYLRTPGGFERLLEARGERTESFDPPPPDWTGHTLEPYRAQGLMDDLGLRQVAVTNPLRTS